MNTSTRPFRKSRLSPVQLAVGGAIVVIVALPLLTMATQFFDGLARLATWSPLELVAVFGALLAVKVVVLLSLGKLLRRNAE